MTHHRACCCGGVDAYVLYRAYTGVVGEDDLRVRKFSGSTGATLWDVSVFANSSGGSAYVSFSQSESYLYVLALDSTVSPRKPKVFKLDKSDGSELASAHIAPQTIGANTYDLPNGISVLQTGKPMLTLKYLTQSWVMGVRLDCDLSIDLAGTTFAEVDDVDARISGTVDQSGDYYYLHTVQRNPGRINTTTMEAVNDPVIVDGSAVGTGPRLYGSTVPGEFMFPSLRSSNSRYILNRGGTLTLEQLSTTAAYDQKYFGCYSSTEAWMPNGVSSFDGVNQSVTHTTSDIETLFYPSSHAGGTLAYASDGGSLFLLRTDNAGLRWTLCKVAVDASSNLTAQWEVEKAYLAPSPDSISDLILDIAGDGRHSASLFTLPPDTCS